MDKEFENKVAGHPGIHPEDQEHRNTPKTIHRDYSTIYSALRLADEICFDPPKTINSGAATTSGKPPKRRGRGAPPGNLNALKTGRYTRNARRLRKQMWEFTSGVGALTRLAAAVGGFEIPRKRPRKQNWPVMPDALRRKYRERPRP
jgi:hypothetical protein